MRRATRFLLSPLALTVVLIGAAGCRGDKAPLAELPSAAAEKIVFFGDSITRGQGLPEAEAFPVLIQAKLTAAGFDYRAVNAGVSGDTTSGALDRLQRYVAESPRLVIVELGANDVFRGIDRRRTYANLVEIVETFQHAGAMVIIAATLFPGLHPAYGHSMDEMYEAVAERTGARLIPDLMTGVAGVVALNLDDRIHPNREGQQRLAETAWPAIEATLREYARTRRH